jgi:UTP--glucose-1-phosphate uridylyltransferase
MRDIYQATGSNVIGVEQIPPELTERYGIAAVRENPGGYLRIFKLVEKPHPSEAPSNLGVVGRYILSPDVFGKLEDLGSGAGGEIQLTDGIARLMGEQAVLAHPFQGQRYDCGSKLGYIQATIDYALDDDSLKKPLLKHLLEVLDSGGS